VVELIFEALIGQKIINNKIVEILIFFQTIIMVPNYEFILSEVSYKK
jgi:hypothetical protein